MVTKRRDHYGTEKETKPLWGKICSRNKDSQKNNILAALGKEQKTKLEKYLSGKRIITIRNERANLQLEKKSSKKA